MLHLEGEAAYTLISWQPLQRVRGRCISPASTSLEKSWRKGPTERFLGQTGQLPVSELPKHWSEAEDH
jgi:hypothetical protein